MESPLPKHAFFRGKIVLYSEAKVGVATHALNYGTAVFGGLRGYWNKEKKKLFVFRPVDHYRRFLSSCRLLCMEFDHTPESLVQLTLELLHKDNYQQDIYIRPLAYKADEQIGVRLHNLTDELTIFALPFGQYIKNDTSAHVTISSWRRIDDNMIPARGKISGAYVNSALAKTDALRAGFDEALVLTQDGHLSEGSAMNLFIVRDNVLITPPVTENILEGITRRTVIELARKELNLTVVERPIDRTEIYICDELILTGTAVQVTVATKIDHRPIGNGVMGPVGEGLRKLFETVARGNNPKYAHWNVAV
ncbi:MAG: branched chain amino acid aminotransferase [Anaerolineae bacterium CG_4_9_14_0_8_um_filter_58_9]|nr:MAG: branched chain amino acid aminotransferase [Anaerolineae bacterium CG_4_9_14_0_8_um_filter_58_9]